MSNESQPTTGTKSNPLLGPAFTSGPATVANSGDATHPDASARLPRGDAQDEPAQRYYFSVVVSRDSTTGDIEITPFHVGHMAATVKFPDTKITIAPNANWNFPWRFINSVGQELWVTTKMLHYVLDEIKRYTDETLTGGFDEDQSH